MNGDAKFGPRIVLGVLGLVTWGAGWAEGGGWARRPAPGAVPTAAVVPAPPAHGVVPTRARIAAPHVYGVVPTAAVGPVPTGFEPSPYPMLGTFFPTPYLLVRGNWPAGGGYSPLGLYGNASMDINSQQFGQSTATISNPRILQMSLTLKF